MKNRNSKDRIIEQAARLFNIQGYAGTSISDITKATGLTKGSVYGRFDSKEDIAKASFKYNHTKMSNLILTEFDKHRNVRDKLLVYAYMYWGYTMGSFPEGGCPILNTATDADDTQPALKRMAYAAFTRWKDNLILLIKAGVRDGEFDSSIVVEERAVAYIALLEGSIMINKLTGEQHLRKFLIESAINFIDEMSTH